MRVLVIGSGAREHALLLALRRDPEVEELAVAPGNAGTAIIADQYDVYITSGDAVVKLAQRIGADLVVVGPEVPLVLDPASVAVPVLDSTAHLAGRCVLYATRALPLPRT